MLQNSILVKTRILNVTNFVLMFWRDIYEIAYYREKFLLQNSIWVVPNGCQCGFVPEKQKQTSKYRSKPIVFSSKVWIFKFYWWQRGDNLSRYIKSGVWKIGAVYLWFICNCGALCNFSGQAKLSSKQRRLMCWAFWCVRFFSFVEFIGTNMSNTLISCTLLSVINTKI